jgi:hypothetical protein
VVPKSIAESHRYRSASLEQTVELMNIALPDANRHRVRVVVIAGLELPDESDRHVLAAAIRAS